MADEHVRALVRVLWQLKLPFDWKLVLVHIADRVNREKGYAFPCVRSIAGACGMRLARAHRVLRDLGRDGCLLIDESARPHRYRLNWEKLGIQPPAKRVPAGGTSVVPISPADVPVLRPDVPAVGTAYRDQRSLTFREQARSARGRYTPPEEGIRDGTFTVVNCGKCGGTHESFYLGGKPIIPACSGSQDVSKRFAEGIRP